MKIQLDTKRKTIKLDEPIRLGEMVKLLKSLFPDKEWESYTLETNTTIHGWSYPVYIEKYTPYTPMWDSITTYAGREVSDKQSLFNLEVKGGTDYGMEATSKTRGGSGSF